MQLKTQQKTGFGIFTQRGFFYSKVSNRRGGGVGGEGGRIIGWLEKIPKTNNRGGGGWKKQKILIVWGWGKLVFKVLFSFLL